MVSKQKLIIVIDDEELVLASIKRCLRKVDAKTIYFSCPLKALEFIQSHSPDIVISDQRMPNLTGTQLLTEIKELHPKAQNILLSAYNDFDDVATAFNNKVIQKYLSKPWGNRELVHLIQTTLNAKTDSDFIYDTTEFPSFHGMISKNDNMKETFEQIRKASSSNIPIFISGDTGTGKELVAKSCHEESCRRDKRFVAVNCANFSESLMESQLFGHIRGAFTGAVNNQKGLLGATNTGTLFLDEITCLPISLQAKLLRVIQEREFTSVGSQKVQKFDIQLITASAMPLAEAVRQGKFREDLYYRLDVISIELPKLAHRGKDSLLLADYFLAKFCASTGKSFHGFSDAAKITLATYSWPGNVRQLENLIHSVVVLNDGVEVNNKMLIKGLPSKSILGHSRTPLDGEYPVIKRSKKRHDVKPLWLAEKEIIENAILLYHGNIPQASAALKVSPSTIYRKIQVWKSKQFI